MEAKDAAPGHYEEGQCVTWAKAVQQKLDFPTLRISWTAKGTDPFDRSVRHQIIAYQVHNEVWMMDNFSLAPRWVGMAGDKLNEMAQQFYAPARVRIENIRIDES